MIKPYAQGRIIGRFDDPQRFVVFALSCPAALIKNGQEAPIQVRWVRARTEIDGGASLEACLGPQEHYAPIPGVWSEHTSDSAASLLRHMGYRVVSEIFCPEEALYAEWLRTMEAFNPSIPPERECRFIDNQPDCADSFLTVKSPRFAVTG